MPITAFSKAFRRELDVKQLEDLHKEFLEEKNLEPNFRNFVESDVECPCCNVFGGKVISEGISSKTGKRVKQTHFAFRNFDGGDAHLIFCDYYTGVDRQNQATNESNITIGKSNDVVTAEIRKYVCAAIEQCIFTQSDIRDMRQWFLEVRSNQDFPIEESYHHLNILQKMATRRYSNRDRNLDLGIKYNQDFDLESAIYKSLAHKLDLPEIPTDNPILKQILSRNTIIKKAISISKKDHGLYGFDRETLEEKYRLAKRLSGTIIVKNSLLIEKLGFNSKNSNNYVMAYSAILLFVSDWNIENAYQKHFLISQVNQINDDTLGNVIGLNPFIHYDAWIALKFVSEWKKKLNDIDLDAEFIKEKDRLKAIYGIE